jgi:hypothetical protein
MAGLETGYATTYPDAPANIRDRIRNIVDANTGKLIKAITGP